MPKRKWRSQGATPKASHTMEMSRDGGQTWEPTSRSAVRTNLGDKALARIIEEGSTEQGGPWQNLYRRNCKSG